MKQIILLVFMSITIIFAGNNDIDNIFSAFPDKLNAGIYRTWEDFYNNSPEPLSDSIIITNDSVSSLILSNAPVRGEYFSINYVDSTGEEQRWRLSQQGNIWGYCDGNNIFFNTNLGSKNLFITLIPVNFSDTLAWCIDRIGGVDMMAEEEAIFHFNLDAPDWPSYIAKTKMVMWDRDEQANQLQSEQDLYEEFNELSKRQKRKQFLRLFLELQNR